MRPVLADRKALSRNFRIGFDPVNTLIMNLVVEGLKPNERQNLRQLPPANRRVLERIYATLTHAQPDDPAAPQLLALVSDRPPAAVGPPALPTPSLPRLEAAPTSRVSPPDDGASLSMPRLQTLLPTIDASRLVLEAVVVSARENSGRPQGRVAAREDLFRRTRDELTEHYVRSAARASRQQNEAVRTQAFFLALAVALDTTNTLREHPLTADLLRQLETAQGRSARLAVIGEPTLLGRHDLAQHFFISAAICSVGGAALAESVGIAKELQDAQGSSGFSFTDLAANLAGIALAEQVQSGAISLSELARSFETPRYLPALEGLQDGLSSAEFAQAYGSRSDPRFLAAVGSIQRQIRRLHEPNGAALSSPTSQSR